MTLLLDTHFLIWIVLGSKRLAGTRALEIAGRLGDLRLRILTTTYLEQAHYFRGDYERVVELATDNLAALPADSDYEYFGNAMPASIYDRSWLALSFGELGRFAEAAPYEGEALRLAEPTHHAYTVGWAHSAAGRQARAGRPAPYRRGDDVPRDGCASGSRRPRRG